MLVFNSATTTVSVGSTTPSSTTISTTTVSKSTGTSTTTLKGIWSTEISQEMQL